jgi:hypothetical protein
MSAIRGGDQQQLSRGCVGQQLAGAVTALIIQRQVVPGILKRRIIRKVANLGEEYDVQVVSNRSGERASRASEFCKAQ